MKRFLPLLFLMATCAGSLWAQSQVTVHGTVTSKDSGEPLLAVTVIGGPTSAVTTGADGTYSITVPAGTRLMFQYMGYLTYWYPVPAMAAGTLIHDVQLESDMQVMDDVVVVAYGVRKKGTVAGSVSTVKADKLENTPTASFDQALQGSTPGLQVVSASGEPSAPASFKIRGTNSINSGTEPLFIMDGIPISSADFNAISPADIESVTVLKDASSTSIYGARAANGVIVITTKRGSALEKARVTYRMQLGFSDLALGKWNVMNTAEVIQYQKEVGLTEGKNYDVLSKTDVNWRDVIFSNFAPLQNHELQVSGASERINYYVSGGWYSQDGMTSDSDFQRYNFRANVEARANKWLKMGTQTMLAYETYSRSESGQYYLNTPISASRFMMPYLNPYRKDGSLASINDGSWKGSGENPLEWVANNPFIAKKYKAISSVFLEIQPINGLVLRSQGGIDYSHGTGTTKSMASYAPNNGEGMVSKTTSDSRTLQITNTINYVFDIQRAHQFNFLLGQEGADFFGDSFSVTSRGQTNDKLTTLSNGTRASGWSDSSSSYALVSVFGRGEYNFKSRYYVDFSIRGDWSSRFGKENRGAAFWSVGLMWNVLGETFMNNAKKWLTTAQVTFSTGTSGNSTIPYYDHLALVSGSARYAGNAGLAPISKGNPYLSWEQLWSTNLALRLGFWNRLNFDVEFYNKQTTKMLMQVPVSYADAGQGSRWDNIGGMVNRGVEFNLSADLVKYKDFVWNVNANASYNHNEITELYSGASEYVLGSTKLMVGHSIGEFFLNRFAGVNPANGDALWYDKDGNITDEYHESDKVMVGKSYIAPWQGGFGTTLSWKGLSLTAQFSWVAERWMMNNDRYFEESGGLFDSYNQSKRMLYDRWKKPGDVTDVPRYGVTPQMDTHLLEDASFLRLKNIMLSYSFPPELIAKTKFMTGLSIYVQAQNLLTFTKFTGLDPESSSAVYAAQYPMSRQFSFGLEINF